MRRAVIGSVPDRIAIATAGCMRAANGSGALERLAAEAALRPPSGGPFKMT